MQIERNLYIPLRSLVERVVEAKEEFASSQVMVDKDKGRQKQNPNQTKDGDKSLEETPTSEDSLKTEAGVKTVLTHRLDLVV
jgi:hypothetical protein